MGGSRRDWSRHTAALGLIPVLAAIIFSAGLTNDGELVADIVLLSATCARGGQCGISGKEELLPIYPLCEPHSRDSRRIRPNPHLHNCQVLLGGGLLCSMGIDPPQLHAPSECPRRRNEWLAGRILKLSKW